MAKKQTFSEQIRQAAKDSGLSQYRIAKEMHLAESTVSRFVRGTSWLSAGNLDRLADLLGMRIVVEAKMVNKPGKDR